MKSFTQHMIDEAAKAMSKDEAAKRFGEILFGEFRKSIGGPLAVSKDEPDTDEESNLIAALSQFIKSPRVTTATYAAFKLLAANKKHFPKVLVPDKTVIYRGLKLSYEDILKKVSFTKKEGVYSISPNFKYQGHSKLQSWTTDAQTAWLFALLDYIHVASTMKPVDAYRKAADRVVSDAYSHPGMKTVSVVLRHVINLKASNNVFNSKFMDILAMDVIGIEEHEVIMLTDGKAIKTDVMIPAEFLTRLLRSSAARRKAGGK